MDHPIFVFCVSLLTLMLSTWIGVFFRNKRREHHEEERHDLGVIVAATLTLLGLIIGFTFSMALGDYGQRTYYEGQETSAIATEYFRADVLPASDAAKLKALLAEFLDQRIAFYTARAEQLKEIDIQTARLQYRLWSALRVSAAPQPNAFSALAVTGMNDVFNTQGYAYAAGSNRIPVAAWCLMAAVAICSNLLIGYGSRGGQSGSVLLLILPVLVSVSVLLIADIDSPREGVILSDPQNLQRLRSFLHRE